MGAFMLHQQHRVVETKAVWPVKPKAEAVGRRLAWELGRPGRWTRYRMRSCRGEMHEPLGTKFWVLDGVMVVRHVLEVSYVFVPLLTVVTKEVTKGK